MQITVHLLAFNDETPIPTRIVDIPDEDAEVATHPDPWLLGSVVFYYGQNDFQPKPVRSVSVGDVIEFPDGRLLKILGISFEALPAGTDLNTLPRGARASLC